MRLPGKVILSMAGALSFFAACSYSPHFTSGDLLCSDQGECPRGYSCSAKKQCCANGDVVCNGSGTGSGGATGSGGGTGHVAADFIGTWTFGATAKVSNECDNNTTGSNMLNNTTLAITAGATGGTALVANWSVWQSYGCPTTISLSYDSTGAQLVDTSWFCQDDTRDPIDFWIVDEFDVTPTSATTATHYAIYELLDTYADGSTVSCLQTVTATMTKTKN